MRYLISNLKKKGGAEMIQINTFKGASLHTDPYYHSGAEIYLDSKKLWVRRVVSPSELELIECQITDKRFPKLFDEFILGSLTENERISVLSAIVNKKDLYVDKEDWILYDVLDPL